MDSSGQNRSQQSPPRVLIVEDNADVCEILSRYLSGHGMDVVICSCAEDAMGVGLQQTFDVLLVDVILPGERGPQFVEHLREAGSRSRVILMTGYALDFDDPTLKAICPDRMILKPCDLSELAEEIRTLTAEAREAKPSSEIRDTVND